MSHTGTSLCPLQHGSVSSIPRLQALRAHSGQSYLGSGSASSAPPNPEWCYWLEGLASVPEPLLAHAVPPPPSGGTAPLSLDWLAAGRHAIQVTRGSLGIHTGSH